MGNYASSIIKLAEQELGYMEKKSNSNLDSKTANAGTANYTKYARDLDKIPNFYNGRKNGFDWCDVFVDWLFVQCFGVEEAKRLLCQPNNSAGAGVKYSAGYFEKENKVYVDPMPGDQIFFVKSNGSLYHTGIVYGVDNDYVYTIEGNTRSGSEIVPNGGMVCKKKYRLDNENIYGYGRPDYDEEEEDMYTMRYNTIEEVPSYATATIKKLIRKGFLKGDDKGLDLNIDMIRTFVILDRAGMFGE